VQAAKAAPSSEHWKVAPASEVNEKLGADELLGFVGCAVIVAVGAVESIVHVYEAAVPVLPAVSLARTWKVCEPSATAVYARGEVQAANAAPSSEHWKVAPASEVNEKLGALELLGFVGCAVIVTVGAVESIDHVYEAAVPVFPAASVALTWKVCEPSATAV
jgi:Na+/proline symporter